jgi:hypothetical protein
VSRREVLGGGLIGLLAIASGCGEDSEKVAAVPVQPDIKNNPPPVQNTPPDGVIRKGQWPGPQKKK